jgi:lipopolysaccharide/colanic/teichoic acid biosynthesis glycosyltransferase
MKTKPSIAILHLVIACLVILLVLPLFMFVAIGVLIIIPPAIIYFHLTDGDQKKQIDLIIKRQNS